MKHNIEVKESFKHWVRVYRWMEKYKCVFGYLPGTHILYFVMCRDIHEDISGSYCALCRKYKNCYGCPLVSCDTGSIWKNVVCSETKEEWLKNAMIMIKKLWSLRYYDDQTFENNLDRWSRKLKEWEELEKENYENKINS